MNFFGINSAAVNGGVNAVIAGAALALSIGSVSANGTRIAPGAASPTTSASMVAKGTRSALSAASFVAQGSLSARWALLSQADAKIVVSSSLKATNTDAYGATTTAGSGATGFITRPGGGIALATSYGTADALFTIGYASDFVVRSALSADASVQRNGQSTVERDGYAVQVGSSSLTAGPLKTAMASALAAVGSGASVDAIRVQGGVARIEASCVFTAEGATDTATIVAFSDFGATPTVTQYAGAEFTTVAETSATQTVFITGETLPFVARAVVTAEGRLALRGAAKGAASSNASATGRMGILSEASIEASSSLFADAETIITPLPVLISVASELSAHWIVLRFGAADLAGLSGMTANAMTNAEAEDPPERTMRREAVDREMIRPFVDREMKREP